MSPSPPVRDRRLIILLILFALILLSAGWWFGTHRMQVDPTVTEPVPPAVGPIRRSHEPPPLRERPQVIPHSLARAVAAVGAYDDGRLPTLDDLPDDERVLVDQARLLIATMPRRAAPGLSMVMPDGTVAGLAPEPTPREPVMKTPPGSGEVDDPSALDARERARAVDGRLVARFLSSGPEAPPPTRGDLVKEILQPDAWIAVPYHPSQVAGEPLMLTNRSLGHYVLRLDASDYGSVRLNGGLVVPGRFYLIDGTMTISSDIPVGVVIRPLGVVHSYSPGPIRPPSANG